MTDNEEEERELETQLEIQLEEQKDSLSVLKEALVSDPTNHELLSVHEELIVAIRDAEDGLFHLKRARLLREADLALQVSRNTADDVKVEPLDPTVIEEEPLEEKQGFSVGSKCRFRHTDGCWYNGQIVGLDGSKYAKISFLTPTSENMLICKFFLQQRCRFGTNCRLSHGVNVSISSLKKYVPSIWEQLVVGSNIWAVSEGKSGIWREAELESLDEKLKLGNVVFRDDGSSSKLPIDSISLSKFAHISDEEEDDSSFEQSDDSNEDEDEEDMTSQSQGLGFLESTTLQRGIQTETAIFAKWENHTRGIASKMMANMGYSEGMGLGLSGQGIVDPVSVKVLKPKQSLDHAFENRGENEESKEEEKKRSRGGKRKRDKKFAQAARDAKDREETRPDVFSLINTKLAMYGEDLTGGGSGAKRQNNREDRRSLVAYDDEVRDLKIRVEKLEEMANRNKREKVVYEAAMRKLSETRKALAEVEAAHASASSAVVSREKEKRWLKF